MASVWLTEAPMLAISICCLCPPPRPALQAVGTGMAALWHGGAHIRQGAHHHSIRWAPWALRAVKPRARTGAAQMRWAAHLGLLPSLVPTVRPWCTCRAPAFGLVPTVRPWCTCRAPAFGLVPT
eukprot:364919-Chlamydomonas_euryale.AAC.1